MVKSVANLIIALSTKAHTHTHTLINNIIKFNCEFNGKLNKSKIVSATVICIQSLLFISSALCFGFRAVQFFD